MDTSSFCKLRLIFLRIVGEFIITLFDSLGFDFGVFSFFVISKASREDLPHTPHDELVRKSLLIFEILMFLELFNVANILF